MDYVIVEGLPAVGKSEALALLARFYPESVRVLPELVKQIVTRQNLDLLRQRDALTAAIAAALPERRASIEDIIGRGFLCIEESHLGVHRAYSLALGDAAFVDAYDEICGEVPKPEAFVRLEIPVSRSIERQRARATRPFDVDAPTLERMLGELDRWHADRATPLFHLDADRPPDAVLRDLVEILDLPYCAARGALGEAFDVLLLLGRPASGKSEFVDFMVSLSPSRRAAAFHIAPFDVVDDFPILWERFEDDDIWERLGRRRLHSRRCDGNYAVTDDGLWAFLIERLNRRVEEILASPRPPSRRTVLVEFSRGGPTGYADALARLSPAILRRAAILYVSVPFEESWRRNVARYDDRRRSGILTHSVPREEMERTYGTDDWPSIAGRSHGSLDIRGVRVPYATMDNVPESTDPTVLEARYAGALQPLYAAWRNHRA